MVLNAVNCKHMRSHKHTHTNTHRITFTLHKPADGRVCMYYIIIRVGCQIHKSIRGNIRSNLPDIIIGYIAGGGQKMTGSKRQIWHDNTGLLCWPVTSVVSAKGDTLLVHKFWAYCPVGIARGIWHRYKDRPFRDSAYLSTSKHNI